MKMTRCFGFLLALVMLTVPAYALDPSAIPKQILPKGSAPKPAVPGPKISLPKNIGVITGKIEIFDTPRGGCTAAQELAR